jgi:nicotinamide-nucleotide amidase
VNVWILKNENTFEILVIGNELLNGTILDTNSYWLSQRIHELGEKLVRKTAVRDELDVISRTVKECLSRKPSWLICVGGLGPTYDDMTLDGVAGALGVKTVLTKESIAVFRSNINNRRSQMKLPKVRRISNASLKMAKIPEGSTPLRNGVGSAPGVLIRSGSTNIVCLPGVPREMKAIFTEEIIPSLRNEASRRVAERWIHVRGVGESKLAPPFRKIAKKYAPTIYIKSHPTGFDKESHSLLAIQIIANYSIDEEDSAIKRLDEANHSVSKAIITRGGEIVQRARP